MGTKLVGFTRGGTSYQISWFPVGGYCKLKGEEMMRQPRDRSEPLAVPEKGSYFAASPLQRIAVSAAGPLFNVIFALLTLTLVWRVGFPIYSADNRIILASDYTLDKLAEVPPATQAGLKTGDRVVAIDGKPVRMFQDILETVSVSPNRDLDFTVDREGRSLSFRLKAVLDRDTEPGRSVSIPG